jgi:hypothetical protein
MQDAEVHSLILERLDQLEDENVRAFLKQVLRHEREILDERNGAYSDEYKQLVEEHIGAEQS